MRKIYIEEDTRDEQVVGVNHGSSSEYGEPSKSSQGWCVLTNTLRDEVLGFGKRTMLTCSISGGQIHSYLSSPDTTPSISDLTPLVPDQKSPVYPKRAIRPLPKRTLRSRLSEEAAESISFPPILPSTSLPSYSQYGEDVAYLNESNIHGHQNGEISDDLDHDHHHDHDHYHDEEDCPHHHCDHDDEDDLDSADDGGSAAVRGGYRSSPRSPLPGRHYRYGSHGARSSPSAPDGYDAFENTNNKKKRKIPTSGGLSLGHASLSADVASMGLGRDGVDDGAGVGQYYGSGNAAIPAGLGVQGAGRGRSSRRISGRNPLGPSVNGSNARLRHDQTLSAAAETKAEPGIISAAIANATALLRKPLTKGQENSGVLDQQTKSPTSSSQFTFTCDTDAPNVTFPEQSLYASSYSQRANNMAAPELSTHGTQPSPNVPQAGQQAPPNQQGPAPTAQGKKSRRRRGDVYALAARQRRLQQEYSNLHHIPSPEDIWICEFCEYESIFGRPPTALIRQYEVKDRKERRRLAEKRRLLEKAKLKGRKGKKQTKNAAKAAHANNPPRDPQNYGNEPLDHLGDEYLDDHDGYDDPIPMPAPTAPRDAQRPMPGSFNGTATSASKQGVPAGGGGVR